MKKRKNRVTAKLRVYPDPILTQVCEPVKDGEDVSGIIRDMMHILVNSKTGVGLAAPQAGHLKRIILVKRSDTAYKAMINPKIHEFKGTMLPGNEGCLSYPGVTKEIARYGIIYMTYLNEDGKARKGGFYNFTARIVQHEIDHLDGKCKVGEK